MNQVFYIIPNTISEPLSFEDEIRHIKNWKYNGDKKSHEILIKNYILFTVKKGGMMYRGLPEDSVLQIAHRALLLAIDGHNPKRAKVGRLCNLIPLYLKVAYRELVKEQQVVKCPVVNDFARFVSLDAEVNPKGSARDLSDTNDFVARSYSDLNYHNDFADTPPSLDELLGFDWSAMDETLQQEKLAALRECIDALSPGHRKIIELVYFKGLNFAQASRKLRPTVTREAVRQKHNKAIQLLRDAVKEKGIFNT